MDKDNYHGYNKNRQRGSHSNSSMLAKPGVVPGLTPVGNRLPNSSTSKPKATETNLLPSVSTSSASSEFSRVEIIQRLCQERGLSQGVSSRISLSQRPSSQRLCETKWRLFGRWCQSKHIDPVTCTVPQLTEFLTYLFEVKKLSVSTIAGYRSCISRVFTARGVNISHHEDLNCLARSFAMERGPILGPHGNPENAHETPLQAFGESEYSRYYKENSISYHFSYG